MSIDFSNRFIEREEEAEKEQECDHCAHCNVTLGSLLNLT